MPKPPSSSAFRNLRTLIQRRFGIVIPSDREEQAHRELIATAARLDIESLNELYARADGHDRNVVQHILSAITITHTTFFREPVAYDSFRQEILPQLDEAEVRVWSAASSTGEELYSLAMIVADALGRDALPARWRFLGTDINPKVIEHAERATYTESQTARIPPSLKERYMERHGDGDYRVCAEIRDLCTFRTMNLVEVPLPVRGPFDVILCRNVLYYFTDQVQRAVLHSLHRATRDRGWLITSSSESIGHLNTPWARHSSVVHRRETLP